MRFFLACLALSACVADYTRAGDTIGGKTVKELTAALKHSDARVRYQAMAVLYEAGADAKPMIKELMRVLKDSQPLIRRAAAQTLGNLGEDAAPAVSALVYAMKDTDPTVRYLAGQALSEVGQAASEPLIALLDDKDATIRLYAIMSMDAMSLNNKEIAKALSKAVKDTNTPVRRAALTALAKLDSEDVYALLGEALKDKELGIRQTALTILSGMGKDSAKVLAKSAEDPAAATRLLAVQALAAMEELDENGVLTLRKALDDKDAKVRQTAALGLAKQGAKARELGGDKEMFQALLKLQGDKDLATRRAAVIALGKIGSENVEEIKAFAAEGLKDADVNVRWLTVQALSLYLGETPPAEVRTLLHGTLIDTLKDKDRRVQLLAAQALASEKEAAVEPLTKLVEEGKGPQRLWAATILGEIGPPALSAADALEKMSKEGGVQSRQIAQTALQKIQP